MNPATLSRRRVDGSLVVLPRSGLSSVFKEHEFTYGDEFEVSESLPRHRKEGGAESRPARHH